MPRYSYYVLEDQEGPEDARSVFSHWEPEHLDFIAEHAAELEMTITGGEASWPCTLVIHRGGAGTNGPELGRCRVDMEMVPYFTAELLESPEASPTAPEEPIVRGPGQFRDAVVWEIQEMQKVGIIKAEEQVEYARDHITEKEYGHMTVTEAATLMCELAAVQDAEGGWTGPPAQYRRERGEAKPQVSWWRRLWCPWRR